MRWLADDHFTFLGYREYDLAEHRGEEVLRAVPGTGLGVLRSDPVSHDTDHHPVAEAFGRLSAPVRAKAHEKKLLVLTKANSRATVHRPAYLDYVGVKKFDANGEVVGERRFLGLFSSAAYTESVTRIPVVRRKVQEVLSDSGFSGDSHDGRDLLQIMETFPGTRSSRPPPTSCSPSPPACSTCRSAAGCGCSCATTTTAATSPPSSTCRATATPRGSGCA